MKLALGSGKRTRHYTCFVLDDGAHISYNIAKKKKLTSKQCAHFVSEDPEQLDSTPSPLGHFLHFTQTRKDGSRNVPVSHPHFRFWFALHSNKATCVGSQRVQGKHFASLFSLSIKVCDYWDKQEETIFIVI